jgi:hypothetical protein
MGRMAMVCNSYIPNNKAKIASNSHHTTHSVLENANCRRLYVIEGLLTIAWAVCCIFLVPKSYETAYFLNAEEKAIMRQRAERAEA